MSSQHEVLEEIPEEPKCAKWVTGIPVEDLTFWLDLEDSDLEDEITGSWESFVHSFHKLTSNLILSTVSLSGNAIERKSTGGLCSQGTFNLVGETEL